MALLFEILYSVAKASIISSIILILHYIGLKSRFATDKKDKPYFYIIIFIILVIGFSIQDFYPFFPLKVNP